MKPTMKRRQFLKVSGGLAGVLASGRAPAYAQGQKLHILRWNDFIPAADAELKRQANKLWREQNPGSPWFKQTVETVLDHRR